MQVAPEYRPPAQVHITVTADAQGEDLREAMDNLAMELCAELELRGIKAEWGPSRVATPRASLRITGWEPGEQALRYFVGFGAGEGHIVVEVDVTTSGEANVLSGEVRGFVTGGFFGGSSTDSVRAVASSVAEVIATGKPGAAAR
jgi:hypothetical protein